MFFLDEKLYLFFIFLVNYIVLSIFSLLVIKIFEMNLQKSIYSNFSKKYCRSFIVFLFFFIGGLPISFPFLLKLFSFINVWNLNSPTVVFIFSALNIFIVLFYFNTMFSLYDYKIKKNPIGDSLYISKDLSYYTLFIAVLLVFFNVFGFLFII